MMDNYLGDRVIIPNKIQKMTKEERRAEIERLEKERILKDNSPMNKGV